MSDHDILPAPAGVTFSTPVTDLGDLARRAAAYARETTAKSTQHAYARDWRAFCAWCRSAGLDPLPADPTTVGLYLSSAADRLAVATLGRRLAAIAAMHRLHGHRLDTGNAAVRDVLRGIRRLRGTAQRRVAAATTSVVRAMAAATCGRSLIDARDSAIVLFGFGAALRRSEIVALDFNDIEIVPEGARVYLRRSKTDQTGEGAVIGVARTGTASCPVAALLNWISAAGVTKGRLFRRIDRHGRIGASLTAQSVALIIKRRAKLIGLDPSGYSGHSLRSGLATSAGQHGVEERIAMRQTRHRSVTTFRIYQRDGELFRDNASGRVGL